MSGPTDLAFTKMHGAGNDFVFLDQRELPSDLVLTQESIAFLCDRRLGVGADGLIIIGPGREGVTDFRMTYFNADGGEVEMCGNGARCSVAFAYARNLVGETCTFDTQAGVLTGEVHGPEDITVSLTGWTDLDLDVALPGSPWEHHCACNTGVPHLVIPVADTENIDLRKWGSTFRHHEIFAPAGTNVNWVSRQEDTGEFLLRTYERGVEDETLACGTGASAAAVVLCHLNQAESPVAVRTRGGDLLQITVDRETGTLLLRGPAVASYSGGIALSG
ncbi:MAG: diaminopimelate epimerase [Candidatus Krumholzibacteria bacterium]|nr:diaminopimelate epimerase [Candidatus Krumholzibacteria bacterium]